MHTGAAHFTREKTKLCCTIGPMFLETMHLRRWQIFIFFFNVDGHWFCASFRNSASFKKIKCDLIRALSTDFVGITPLSVSKNVKAMYRRQPKQLCLPWSRLTWVETSWKYDKSMNNWAIEFKFLKKLLFHASFS